MSENIFTYANNYSGFTQGTVNERTGSFDFSINLVKINANGLKGPELDLNLSVNPSSTQDQGFGVGLVLGLPSIDLVNHVFHNTSGVSVKLDVRNTQPVEPALLDFKIQQISGNQFIVKYATGETDYLTADSRRQTAVLSKRENALGLGLSLDWSVTGELNRIYDDENIEYFSNRRIGFGSTKELSIFSGRYFVSTSESRGIYTITVPYELSGGYADANRYQVFTQLDNRTQVRLINRVVLPDNSAHELTYNQYLLLPPGGSTSQLPAVTEHKIQKSGATIKQVNFNFLPEGFNGPNAYGYGANIPYQEYSDTLYRIRHRYFYKTEKTETDHNGKSTVTTNTYDKFHNLIEVKRVCGACEKQDLMTYFTDDNQDVSKQSKKFKLLKKSEVKYINSGLERTEVVHYEYDDYGNLLSEYDESKGFEIKYIYHNTLLRGSDECPQYEFVHFLKSQTNFDKVSNSSRIVSYRKYHQLSAMIPNSIIIKEDHNQYSDTVVKYEYYSDKPNIGRLKQQSLIHNGYENKDTYEYVQTGNFLSIKEENYYVSNMNDKLTSENVYDKFSNSIVSKNEQGISVAFDYYFDGRLKQETTAAQTDKEFKQVYYYNDVENTVRVVDQKGNEKTTEYNISGQVTKRWLTIPGVKSNYLSLLNTYNQLGQQVSSTEYDTSLLSSTSIPVQQKTWALTIQYQYDDWGELEKVIAPDGQIQFDSFDPVTNVYKSGTQGLILKYQTVNAANRTIKEEYFDAANRKMNTGFTMYLDGFDLPRRRVTDRGVTTSFEYDALDRLVRQKETGNDVVGSITTETTYSPYHISSDFIESIAVNDHTLGRREYDGFGRLLKEITGSKETRFTYDQGRLNYSGYVLANGQRLDATFDIELGEYTGVGIVQTRLDDVTGLPISTSRSDIQDSINYEYRFDGEIVRERVGLDENLYEYTLAGARLLSSFSRLDFESIQYDDLQRVKIKQDALNTATYEHYDEFSRVTKIVVTGENPSTIEFDYSQFPEQVVTTVSQGSDTLTETINFATDGKVSSKSTDLNGSTLDESYTYNSFGQLTNYHAVGARLPKDQYGNTIRSQEFTYDGFGNVSMVDTHFTDESVDSAIFSYASDYPTRLHTVTHSHSDYSNLDFSDAYDDFGNLIKDEKGLSYSFNQYGEMQSVYDESGVEVTRYKYDAQGRLVSQSITEQPDMEYIYSGDGLVSQRQGDFKTNSSVIEGRLIGKRISGNGANVINSYLADSNNTPLKVNKTGDVQGSSEYVYTPYGFRMEA
ncbi:hypothetical protein [Vibrio coralliilyticus]|uniref:hypothetical protein n=1 Tax=Vibrio coralliilyticus TaxID=190893 RepID=UPI002FD22968